MTVEQHRAELIRLVETLDEEELRVLYAYLVALESGDAEALEALEAAKDMEDFERVKNISEQVIARAGDST